MQTLQYLLALLILNANVASAQKDSVLNTSIGATFSFGAANFTTDNLGNIYLLSPTNQIKKLNSKGDSVAVFNDVRRYGKIFSIDATNPLKVLVYYKEFSTIVVLDRFLNVRNTIDLRQQNILQTSAVTSTYDNNIWLFDELENKLKKIDDNGKLLLETADFRQVFDEAINPSNIYDRDGMVYLYDSSKGLITFDYYGAKRNQFNIKGVTDLQVIDKNTIVGRKNADIFLYKPSTLQSFSFVLKSSLNNVKRISFNNNRLYLLSNDGLLNIYNIN